MLSVTQHTAYTSGTELDFAVKEIVRQALDILGQQTGNTLDQILRLRFLDRLTAQQVANRLNLSENVVFKRQQAAIESLADIIWRFEISARAKHAERIRSRLELGGTWQLFGVNDKLDKLVDLLTANRAPWIVAVVGIGGIGKTVLADAGMRRVLGLSAFADIAWVSARQSSFTLWQGLRPIPDKRPALTYENLLDTVAEQFGFRDLAQLSGRQKQEALRTRLQTRRYLVAIDNLETAADYQALLPSLCALGGPTRFLLTCRDRLDGYPDVYNLNLGELSAQDSLALLRHQVQERGLAGVVGAPDETLFQIYQATGGNPLAIKLVVGQMHAFSTHQIIQDLRQARGKSIQELYRHIYWRAWQMLSTKAQQVWAVMPLVAESGGGIQQIAAISQIRGGQLIETLQQLVALSLVDVRGAADARRYSIHRLTETFLLNEVVRWQARS